MNIAIIGMGRVGATVAYTIISKNLATKLILVDVNHERCEGELRDLADALVFSETAHIVQGDINAAREADIIIITAGFAQKVGESRLQLLSKNKAIMADITKQLLPLRRETIILVITNPMDLMTMEVLKQSTLPDTHVFGTGTWLDTQRLRRYLANELEVDPDSIDAFVIGEHGDNQIVAWSQAHVGGVSITNAGISESILADIATRTANEAYEIIKRKGATYYGIAACAVDICEAVIFDQKRIIPISCWNPDLGVCMSHPVILGKNGFERSIIMQLSPTEREHLRASATHMKEVFESA